jgi:NhaP-type Na+/H+ or K+/H+ antiporter
MVIIVAIFIQGTTIRWLVLLLRIEVTRERPEEELKNLTGTQMELRAEEFDMALQVKDVDLMIDKLEKLHTFTKNQPSNNEYKEFVQSNMYLMKQMITLMMDPVQDLKNRLIVRYLVSI